MKRALAVAVLLGLWCAGARAEEVAPTDARLVEMQEALAEGNRLVGAGRYAEAVPRVERALALGEAALGATHPQVARCLDLLGTIHRRQGRPSRAEPLLQRALEIRMAALDKDPSSVATSLNHLIILYLTQGQYSRAKPLAERALAIEEAAFGKDHPDVAISLNNLAYLHTQQGQYAQALPLVERALAIAEATLGKVHPNVATALNNLAYLHEKQGQFARAPPLVERALAIAEATLGKDHPNVATYLNNLAALHEKQGQFARALPLYERALAIREAVLGRDHPDVATSLNNLASIHTQQGQYARALPLYERALAIQKAAFGKGHPDVATSLNNLAHLHELQGQYARALSLAKRGLVIRQAVLGNGHPDVATSLNNLASIHTQQGQYARALPLNERALAIREAAFGQDHPDVATSLNNLVTLHTQQGQYGRAMPLAKRALAIREATLGQDHPDVAISLNNLAALHEKQGQYARALSLYERALKIAEDVLGKDHPRVATSLNNLASLHEQQGQYARALSPYERALAIRQAVLGKDHPDVATSLNNLANLHTYQGQYTRALPLYERALAIRQAVLGKDHPDATTSLNNLANLHAQQGQYGRAMPLAKRALAIREATLGEKHPDVATALNNLAFLHTQQGQYARAMPLAKRALAIAEATLGEKHPDAASSLNNLAQFHLAQQNLDAALPLLQRALTSSELHLRQQVFGYSEARMASFLSLLRGEEEILYSLVHAYPEDERVRRLALTSALLFKSRSVEELASTSQIIYRDLRGEADSEDFERLRGLYTQLATLSLTCEKQGPTPDFPHCLKKKTEEIETLETQLANRSERLREHHALPHPDEILTHVAQALPEDGALVEFVAYRPNSLILSPGASASSSPGEPRYLALLLFADGRTLALDLGPTAPINVAVQNLHTAFTNQALAYQPDAEALYTLVFRPLAPHLGEVRRLFLSPDEQLSLVPFAALHDGTRFLVDGWDMTYLTSGKDLLRRLEDRAPEHAVVVFANPDFSVPPGRTDTAKRWDPLPGTRQEAEGIQRQLPQARLLTGANATKQELLKQKAPGVLHIATHGFLLEHTAREDKAAAAPEGTRAPQDLAIAPLTARLPKCPVDHPLLCSGLALATAHTASQEESLVLAQELIGMDLWGTQLVVLSACDSGRGDVERGQGVYGLRRALVVAGAETVVTSLWKARDGTTGELMEGYYRRLLAGQGRTAALREAMRELRQKHPHPFFWAPFISLGQDAPLRKLTPVTAARPAP